MTWIRQHIIVEVVYSCGTVIVCGIVHVTLDCGEFTTIDVETMASSKEVAGAIGILMKDTQSAWNLVLPGIFGTFLNISILSTKLCICQWGVDLGLLRYFLGRVGLSIVRNSENRDKKEESKFLYKKICIYCRIFSLSAILAQYYESWAQRIDGPSFVSPRYISMESNHSLACPSQRTILLIRISHLTWFVPLRAQFYLPHS